MNGAQDLGGMHGFGPVSPEPNEPVFHAEWERRVFALTVAMGFTGQWNIDTSRHARETLDPAHYLSSSYYRIWLAGLQKLLVRNELASREELRSGESTNAAAELQRILAAEDVERLLGRGGPSEREVPSPPAFAAGAKVRARNINPPGHTRLPRYARGRTGTVDRVHGAHVFPDANAHGKGEAPQWLYSVKFAAEELWGGEDPDGDAVFIDMWESYLDPV
jgi:nitrile hydratase